MSRRACFRDRPAKAVCCETGGCLPAFSSESAAWRLFDGLPICSQAGNGHCFSHQIFIYRYLCLHISPRIRNAEYKYTINYSNIGPVHEMRYDYCRWRRGCGKAFFMNVRRHTMKHWRQAPKLPSHRPSLNSCSQQF